MAAQPSLLDARFVRVRNRRPNGIVEFDFAIGEPEIFVELILPDTAFDRFCADNRVTDLTGRTPAPDGFDARLSRVQSAD